VRLQLSNPSFLDPKYELVVLVPEDAKNVLLHYDPAQGGPKIYVPSPDHRLRESPGDLTCPQFPSFSGPTRQPDAKLNPFLVILYAEIMFQSCFDFPLPKIFPNDVLELMKETIEVVDLIYWKPRKNRRRKVQKSNKDLDLEARIEEGYALLFGHGGLSASLLYFFLH